VISGLVASLFSSLLVIPCLYMVLDEIRSRRRRLLQELPQ